jgi:hypothetical protein
MRIHGRDAGHTIIGFLRRGAVAYNRLQAAVASIGCGSAAGHLQPP